MITKQGGILVVKNNKLLLIYPKTLFKYDCFKYKSFVEIPPLSLGIIAALSDGWDVSIIDENIDKINFDASVDLVGITIQHTYSAHAAYKIAREFKQRNITVVLGGGHTSVLPDESLQYADSVVIGEAEYVWPQLLKDFENNYLKERYQSDTVVKPEDIPNPRRDLFSNKYLFHSVQATRGCPFQCKFCFSTATPGGRKFRKRPIENVYNEIQELPMNHFWFIDDNLYTDGVYAKELLDRISPLKKKWWSYTSVNVSKDEELIKKMSEAGCLSVAIGFESAIQESSDEYSKIKKPIVNDYKKIVDMYHKYGIAVLGFFIFGFESDPKDVFEKTTTLIKEIGVDDSLLFILTPFPGTKLYDELKKEGRIFDNDWTKYTETNCVFTPTQMTPEEITEGFHNACHEVYSYLIKPRFSMIKTYYRILKKSPLLFCKIGVRGEGFKYIDSRKFL